VSSASSQSPFWPALESLAGQLPTVLREQYLLPTDAPYRIVLGGTMQEIWRRPSWTWPIFWLLALGNIFFPETGQRIPTQLIITAGRDADGTPTQSWDRRFFFPGRRRRYCSTMRFDAASGLVVERQGPAECFWEWARVRFEAPGSLEFLTVRSVLRLGQLSIPLPRWLWVTAHVVERADPSMANAIDVALTIRHPLLGAIFGYAGAFKVTRRPLDQPLPGA